MSLLCIVTAASIVSLDLPDNRFTLSWMHSVEKTRWAETYELVPDGLRLVEARIKGSGAGMEPPPDAALTEDGTFAYQPRSTILPELSLAASSYTSDYTLCVGPRCQLLTSLASIDERGVRFKPCERREP